MILNFKEFMKWLDAEIEETEKIKGWPGKWCYIMGLNRVRSKLKKVV